MAGEESRYVYDFDKMPPRSYQLRGFLFPSGEHILQSGRGTWGAYSRGVYGDLLIDRLESFAMAVVRKLVADNHSINPYAEIINVLDTRFLDMPLLTESFMEVGLRSY